MLQQGRLYLLQSALLVLTQLRHGLDIAGKCRDAVDHRCVLFQDPVSDQGLKRGTGDLLMRR